VLHELRERWSPPQRERIHERSSGDETGEPDGVDRLGIDVEAVAGRSPNERVADYPAQLRDPKMQRVARVGGKRFAPQRVDQPILREHPAGFSGQQREERPFAGSLHVPDAPVLDELQRSEQSNLHSQSPR
jgi:hypothetical protein